MQHIDSIYINGQFVQPLGTELFDLISPVTERLIGRVRLGDERDVQRAVAAAKTAHQRLSRTRPEERMMYLQRLHDAVARHADVLTATMVEEYGGPVSFSAACVAWASSSFQLNRKLLETFEFTREIGNTRVVLEPLGVVGIITPWNANYGFICSKLATAIAAGNTVVIKPSELSALQTQRLTECLHEADLPPGIFNIVNGRGDTVGAEITRHPDIAKISFTGSTATGKRIARAAVDTMKRLTLELGGKSPSVILDDADLDTAIPLAVAAVSINSGQACVAGSRLIVPEHQLDEIKQRLRVAVNALRVGDPEHAETAIGPMVSKQQYARVQRYIRLGIDEGAELLVGGEGRPDGLAVGYFVKPTVFTQVTPTMTIAKEEIFGPVLSVLTYKTEEEAIAMANDTIYGLQAYVFSSDSARAQNIASQIVAGRVFINGLYDEPEAPFGGFKQSGIGREFGSWGLEEYLETKGIMGLGSFRL